MGAIFMEDWYFIAEQQAPATHPKHPERTAALHIVPVTVPRVSRSCKHFPDGSDLHLVHVTGIFFQTLHLGGGKMVCDFK